jgi:CMP-N-acetylneuraminic acid synthetase
VFDNVILSSDGGFEDLGEWPGDDGFFIFDNERPEQYATDDATTDDLLYYYSKTREYKDVDLWAILQLTSPFRTAEDIKKAHKMITREKWDSLVSVTPNPVMGWVKDATNNGHVALYHYTNRPFRQDRKSWFLENGAIYFTKKYVLESFKNRLGGAIALYKMPQERSWEIDTEFDWEIAEYLMNGRK